MNIHKKRNILFLLLIVLVFSLCRAASAGSKYTRLINEMSSKDTRTVMTAADKSERRGDNERALVLYMMVGKRFRTDLTDDEKALLTEAYRRSGDIYYNRGDYPTALEMYVEGMKVCEATRQKKRMAILLKNTGNVYCVFDDLERGAMFYQKAYKESKRSGDKTTERKILTNLTALCLYLGKTSEARKYYNASLRMKDKYDIENTFMINYNQGLIFSAEGSYDKAVLCFRSLAFLAKRQKVAPKYLCSVYQELAKAYSDIGNTDSTRQYLDLCWREAKVHKIQHMYVEVLKDYSSLYERLGNKAEAQRFKADYLTMRDSIYNTRRFDMVKNMQLQYEMTKIDKEISTLHAHQQHREEIISFQRTMLIIVFASTLFITAFLIIVYRQKKKLDRSYNDLYVLNRKAIDNYEAMKTRRADDQRTISSLKNKLQQLELGISSAQEIVKSAPQFVQSSSSSGIITSSQSREDVPAHRQHGMDEDKMKALAETITEVMDNGDEFCSPDFSIDCLASLVDSNQKYVSLVINNIFKKTFRDYLNEYRIAVACKRLANDSEYANLTTKAIGESLGYKSHTSFINIFRKLTGLTPAQYQKMSMRGK